MEVPVDHRLLPRLPPRDRDWDDLVVEAPRLDRLRRLALGVARKLVLVLAAHVVLFGNVLSCNGNKKFKSISKHAFSHDDASRFFLLLHRLFPCVWG